MKEIVLEKSLAKYKTKKLTDINTKPFQGKRLMTYGTYDLLHIGHIKIIEHLIEISGDESLVYIGVSSDKWNGLKGKKADQTQEKRIEKLIHKYPNATIFLEDHDEPEKTWPETWDKYKISLIVMGGDHVDTLDYINNIVTPKGDKMKIMFYERTPKISSTLLRSFKSE